MPKMSLVGMDAVALFPSLSGKRTSRIVRKRIMASKMKMKGLQWRRGMIYIRINRKLTSGIPKEIRKYLPLRKSSQGVEPGMASQSLRKDDALENQWYFHYKDPREEEIRMMIAVVAEIGVRILWENYCYDFGGETHIQAEGGPIGQRPTMAAARIVMNDFFEEYERILKGADLRITLLKVYVDDGRQVTSILKEGMRYNTEKKEFEWSEKAEEEDKEKKRNGEDEDMFMARLCLPVLNSINPDLTFTAEVAGDFSTKKLPTLDFNMWLKKDQHLSHNYFEKEMKSQMLLEKESAMGMKQKYCINSNELTRRLYVIDEQDEKGEEEVTKTIEDFTRQLKNSGWDRLEAKEMVVSGFVAWRRRVKRRVEEGSELYRSAASSLHTRARKKLTSKEDWYKGRTNKRKRDEFDQPEGVKKKKKKEENIAENKDGTVSVMFVPFTKGGELAKRLREAEEDLQRQTGVKIKIVERTGQKLVDVLHRADPWQGQDCGRPQCLLCETKTKTEKNMRQDCTKRCIIYETWCMSCEDKEVKRIEEETDDERENVRKMEGIKLYKYIGESSRSIYERGLEHLRDKEEIKADSHMIKHFFDKHSDEQLEDMRFGVRILKQAKTAFTRQIGESVAIQSNKNHHLLNSKSKYNRCALPRLSAKLGEVTIASLEKEKRQEKEQEEELRKKIRALKIRMSEKRREKPGQTEQPAPKKRKLTVGYKRVIQKEQNAEKREGENDIDERKTHWMFKRRKKADQEFEEYLLEKEIEEKGLTTMKSEEQLQQEWEERLRHREEQMMTENAEREKRRKKARRLKQSFELLRLCKETLENEGATWEKSKERRELEKQRLCRVQEGQTKKEALIQKRE